ncbi:MAG: DUF1700 domain-containing protein [Lachnospiraceae bacterium]|jgi:uncharacterized membrane protein|nr:DUF1700 domain-containing protein [Lachnospiraceae bacterium]
MNRNEFLRELGEYLTGIPSDEKQNALRFYEDYFDDAGAENEANVIEELKSPKKLAEAIIADIMGTEPPIQDGSEEGLVLYKSSTKGKYHYTGEAYAGTSGGNNGNGADKAAGKEGTSAGNSGTPHVPPHRMSGVALIFMILGIIFIGIPIVLPIACAIFVTILCILISLIAVLISLVAAALAIMVSGVALFILGIINLFQAFAVGMALMGSGLIIAVIGLMLTIALVKLCIVVFPAMIRGFVWICSRPFRRRKAVAS